MWFFHYQAIRARREGPASVAVGHFLSKDHPILAVRRWQEADRARGLHTTYILAGYQALSESELALLLAAGVDASAVDSSTHIS